MELETQQQTDEALVARFCRGDVDAFGRLYQRHRHGLYGYALSLWGESAAAADLVQEMWLKFFEDADKLSDAENVRAYLYRSLRNRTLDEFRRRGTERKALSNMDKPVLVKARDTVASREEAERLNEALERLPDDQREVILLRIYSGMKFNEVADVLQTPLKTVESRYRLALDKLQGWLKADEHE